MATKKERMGTKFIPLKENPACETPSLHQLRFSLGSVCKKTNYHSKCIKGEGGKWAEIGRLTVLIFSKDMLPFFGSNNANCSRR